MDDSTIKAGITKKWDSSAEQYDDRVSHGILTAEEKRLWMNVFRAVLPEGPLRILDVGCGTGAMGLLLSEMGYDVIGIDLSEKMMEVGQKKNEKRRLSMIFIKGDAENPPFEDNYFDVVINRHLLWTLPHPDIALASWKRTVKPNGQVIVIDGVWDDGEKITKIRRNLSAALEKIFDPVPSPSGYDEEVLEILPNAGGVSDSNARKYFSKAGFKNIYLNNLIHIRDSQKKQLKWYQKIQHHWSYYLISGTKEV